MRILYLDLDTLRPDHLGCYGYHRNTSPNIDRIAAEGVRFERCYASDVPCCPSRTALMSGRFGIHTGLVGHGGTAGDVRHEGPTRGFRGRLGTESLPGLLRGLGYHTASISPFAERHGAFHFYAGFNEMHNTGKGGMESAEEVTPGALEWIARNATRDDWFLHLNYWDAHVPYRAPGDFGNPFDDQPLPAWLTEEEVSRHVRLPGYQQARNKELVFRRYAQGTTHQVTREGLPPLPRNPNQVRSLEDVRAIVDGYDCGVRYMDEHLGRVLAALEELGVLEETVVIISADHGENLGELGIYGDHVTADDATCHVPLIVRWPGGARGHVDTGLHYQLDLAPTLAELHGSAAVEGWDGLSFAPAILAGEACGRETLVLSTGAGTCQRGARFTSDGGDWLYVRTYHDGYNLIPTEMLFNLGQDPHQQQDMAADRPELCREGAHVLMGWHDEMMASMTDGYAEDPLWTVLREGGPSHVRGKLPAYLRELEAAGDHGAADELRSRHPAEAIA